MVAIYRFKLYSPQADDMILSQRWGTLEAIQKIAGIPIQGTAVEVDPTAIVNASPDMQGLTERGFDPRPQVHGGDGG